MISDNWDDGSPWNTGFSNDPKIIIDGYNNLHIVWYDTTPGPWTSGISDSEIMYANYTVAKGQWSNATVISDGFNNVWGWNTGESSDPDIAIDDSNNLHVVWQDNTPGPWGGDLGDYEIMYANYTTATGQWSNATVISDKWEDGSEWNIDNSYSPKIAVSGSDIHVVWHDRTDGIWGVDQEIMYVNSTNGFGWSDAIVISDGYNDEWGWNSWSSFYPDITIESTNIYVVWHDQTPGPWGGGSNDAEIMCVNYSNGIGWSNVTVISDKWDDGSEWNIGSSMYPKIVSKGSDNLHVVWQDETPGAWGGGDTDAEIMYASYTDTMGEWSNATVISDKWEDGSPWNLWSSWNPDIDIDDSNNIHVFWEDYTAGPWGIGTDVDTEIMYTSYTDATGEWSNATVISDKWEDGSEWNTAESEDVSIAIDNLGNIHAVWQDNTNGIWGMDTEIMYTNNIIVPYYGGSTSSGNGDDDDDDDGEAIPGYNLFILFGVIGLISLILIFRHLKKRDFFNK